jgi:protein-disulfide isomerase
MLLYACLTTLLVLGGPPTPRPAPTAPAVGAETTTAAKSARPAAGARAGNAPEASAAATKADIDRLPATDRQHFDQVAGDEFCGCSSPLTLAACLETRPECAVAQRIGRVLARATASHAPQRAVAAFASQAVIGPFCAPPVKFTLAGAARKGPAKAPITVVEFADFRCTHCRHAVPKVHAALQRFGDQVQLIYAPLVLDERSSAMDAAEAAMAALDQNKFWPMHAALFANEVSEYDATILLAAAKTAGLNIKRFQADMAAHKNKEKLAQFKSEALAAGLTGTPVFFINGRRYEFEPDMFPLDERIQMELDRDVGKCD